MLSKDVYIFRSTELEIFVQQRVDIQAKVRHMSVHVTAAEIGHWFMKLNGLPWRSFWPKPINHSGVMQLLKSDVVQMW